jgi:hypothetical protein
MTMWTALLVTMGFSAASSSDAAPRREVPKILARGVWPVREDKNERLVLHDPQELAVALGVAPKDARERRFQNDAVADTAKLLKVKDIDWNKQMLVVVAVGSRRTGGYRVEIESLTVKDEALVVKWKLHEPRPGDVVTQAITYPTQMVLVDKFQGRILFDPPAEKK